MTTPTTTTPHEAPGAAPTRRWWARFALFVIVGFAILCALDYIAYSVMLRPELRTREWYYTLRSMGSVYVWIIVAVVFFLHDARGARTLRAASRRAGAVLISVFAAGLLAELLKLITRRERPMLNEGAHAFRSYFERTFSTSGMDLPSSHAAIAFAGAFTLAWLLPRAAPVWLALAAGCALTRMLTGAHFLSSLFLAGALAYAIVRLVRVLDANVHKDHAAEIAA